MRKQSLILLAILALGLAGCGQKSETASPEGQPQDQAMMNAAAPAMSEQQTAGNSSQTQPMENAAMPTDNAAQVPASEANLAVPPATGEQQPSAADMGTNGTAANANQQDNTDTIEQD